MLSTVACETWADWNVTPLLKGEGAGHSGKEMTTVAVVREECSAWVYQIVAEWMDGKSRCRCVRSAGFSGINLRTGRSLWRPWLRDRRKGRKES